MALEGQGAADQGSDAASDQESQKSARQDGQGQEPQGTGQGPNPQEDASAEAVGDGTGNGEGGQSDTDSTIRDLRREAAGYRTRAREAEESLQALRAEHQSGQERIDALQTQVREATTAREVASIAVRMGFHDPGDAAAFLDLDSFELDESGNPRGVEDALQGLAATKPHLVRGPGQARGDAPAGSGGEGGGVTMTDRIRQATGRP